MEESNTGSSVQDQLEMTVILHPSPVNPRAQAVRSSYGFRTAIASDVERNGTMQAIPLEIEEQDVPPLREGAASEVSDNQATSAASSTDRNEMTATLHPDPLNPWAQAMRSGPGNPSYVERDDTMESISLETETGEQDEQPLHNGATSEASGRTVSGFTGIRICASWIRRCISKCPPSFAMIRPCISTLLPTILWIVLSAVLVCLMYFFYCHYFYSLTLHQDYAIERFYANIDKIDADGVFSLQPSRLCPTLVKVQGVLYLNRTGFSLNTAVPDKNRTWAIVGLIITSIVWAVSSGLCFYAQSKMLIKRFREHQN